MALLECDFDVVGHISQSMQHEAETLAFCCEFFEHFGAQDMAFCVLVNHTGLMEAVMKLCHVRSAHREAVLKLFSQAARFTQEKLVAKVSDVTVLQPNQKRLIAAPRLLKSLSWPSHKPCCCRRS
jgi:histidyl-tRNA synthetase